jgi:FkbM family methyltransferase
MGISNTPKLVAELIARGVFHDDRLFFVDVGASGGIAPHWHAFGASLKAVGFDPLAKEVDRLNAEQPNTSVRYHAALVGYRRYRELLPDHPVPSNDAYWRSSSVRAQKLLACRYAETYFDQTHDGTLSSELIELDEYFLRAHPASVDFIKIDTDGHDLEVLLGAKELLIQAPVMGLLVEAPFLGPLHESVTLFSNMDVFLRDLGFSIFDIEPRRYTRAALPKQFQWRLPANTIEGQVVWADCLYMRDATIDNYERVWNLPLSSSKLLKLCCLYDLFSLQDCAAELLVKYRERLAGQVDVDHCLDLLTPPLPDGRQVSYREYNDFFDKNVEAFYP